MIAVGAGMVLFGTASAKENSGLVQVGVFLLIASGFGILHPLCWTIRSLRTARELLADPDTEITFRDHRVQLYRPEIKIREEITVHNRQAKSETIIRPSGYVLLPSWIMDNSERYGIKLPPSDAVEK